MKKGFTLIELLAVIVLIGIIALITLPKIADSIEKSKKNVAENSARGYIDAIEKYVLNEQMERENIKLNGIYNINSNGNIYNFDEEYQLQYDGKKPKNGAIKYQKNEIVSGCITIDKYKVIIENSEVVRSEKGQCEYSELASLPPIVTSGDGLYNSTTDPGRLIYRGENPDNYIWLDENGDNKKTNEELYRIISYETDGTIKVVRNEKLSQNKVWDTANERKTDGTNNTFCTSNQGCNVWGNQSNTLYKSTPLGDNFHYTFYETSTTNILSNSESSGKVETNSTLSNYLNNEWLESTKLSDYINNHKFNVNGIYYFETYADGDKGITKEKDEESLYTWTGKVALPNITEYVESSIAPSCISIYSNYYNALDENNNNIKDNLPAEGWPCKTKNWNYKSYSQWSITPNSGSNASVWNMGATGAFYHSNASYTSAIRPAFYLKLSVILSGKGTQTEPYYIIN